MPDLIKNIDHIMQERLAGAQMEPSADLWSNIEAQIDTSGMKAAKTSGKFAKLKLAGLVTVFSAIVGIIGFIGFKSDLIRI